MKSQLNLSVVSDSAPIWIVDYTNVDRQFVLFRDILVIRLVVRVGEGCNNLAVP